MPTRDKDPNCNNKKAHIGNDYVTIVYNDSCDTYSMGTIRVRTRTRADGASKVRTRTNYVVKVRTRADGNDGAIKVVRTRTGRVINVRVRTRTCTLP